MTSHPLLVIANHSAVSLVMVTLALLWLRERESECLQDLFLSIKMLIMDCINDPFNDIYIAYQ